MGNTILDKTGGSFAVLIEKITKDLNITVDQLMEQYLVTNHSLESWRYLDPSQSKYDFTFNAGVSTPVPGESLLDKNSWFGIIGMSLCFKKCDYTAATSTYSNHGNYSVKTWPTPAYFNGPASAAGKTEWQNLNTIEEGKVSLRSGTSDMFNGFKAREFFIQNINSESASPLDHQQYGPSLDERGFFQFAPHFILDGGQDNVLTIELANGDRSIIDGSNSPLTNTRNLIGVRAFGVIVRNTSAQSCNVKRAF